MRPRKEDAVDGIQGICQMENIIEGKWIFELFNESVAHAGEMRVLIN